MCKPLNTTTKPECKCQECGKSCWRVKGTAIYGNLYQTRDKWFWKCVCGAYVGSHAESGEPLGTAAGPALRMKRRAAHAVFDKLWQHKHETTGMSRHEARSAGYQWLARQMAKPVDQMHIALLTVEECREVIRICKPFYERIEQKYEAKIKAAQEAVS